MSDTRTNNSIKNSSSSVISYLILTALSFISQTFFIRTLGKELLGLNGLFANILSMLSLFELGVGSAIIFNLYEPIAKNDIDEINSLMSFYKKAYNFIAILILVIGLFILPFIPYIVEDTTLNINLYLAYLLSLFSTVSSYVLSYKRSILYAYQKIYVINIVHSIYLILLNLIQILLLIYTKNYYYYLIVKIVCQLFENLILSFIANKYYPFIKNKAKELSKEKEKNIFIKVKAMILHKIGGILVFSTDNLIINKFLGLIAVGIYSNYNLIINSINNLVCKFVESLIPSIGNLIVKKDSEKVYDIFKKTRFINFWLSTFTAVCLLLLLNPFIKIWLGGDFLLSEIIVLILIISYFQKVERYTYSTFKNSAGIWETDKYVPLLEALVNLIVSVVLAYYIGLIGVFIGTIISGLVIWLYGYPKFIYVPLFKKNYKSYYLDIFKHFIVFILIAIISLSFSKILAFNNIYIDFIIKFLICAVIPNILFYLFYRKSNECKYLLNLIKSLTKKIIPSRKNS